MRVALFIYTIMINVRIKIGDGAIEDTFAAHKLIYIDADNRTEAPIKKRDVTSYAEKAGDNTDPRTVQDDFDYKVQFVIDGQDKDLKRVNSIIAAFNKKLYTQPANSDIRTYKAAQLARRVGVLAQKNAVGYAYTVEEVVRLGRYAHSRVIFGVYED